MLKETYFTPENITAVSLSMLEELREEGLLRNRTYDFRNCCLIVLDMQKYFLEESSHAFIPSAKAIIPNIKNLINSAEKTGIPIIFTRHINTAENAGCMKLWWNDLLTSDSEMSELVEELPFPGNIIIEKSQYDAFYRRNLEEILIEKSIKSIIITGVMTNLCCETTARSAFVRGFIPIFAVDATAAYTRRLHLSSLRNMAQGFSEPMLTDSIIKGLMQ